MASISAKRSTPRQNRRGIAAEGGRPYKGARIEAMQALDGVRNAVGEVRNFGGKEIPMGLTAGQCRPPRQGIQLRSGEVFHHALAAIYQMGQADRQLTRKAQSFRSSTTAVGSDDNRASQTRRHQAAFFSAGMSTLSPLDQCLRSALPEGAPGT